MDIEKKLPTRKNTRLQVFDYNIPTAYFVTICTAHKKQILSNIVGGDVLDAPQSDDINVAKVELLKQKNYTASLDINGEEYASATVTLQLSE